MPINRPSRAFRVRTTAPSSFIDTSRTRQHEGRLRLFSKLCSPTQIHKQPTFSWVGGSGSRCPKTESTRTLAAAEDETSAIDAPLWTVEEPALSMSPTLSVKNIEYEKKSQKVRTELSIFVLPLDAAVRQGDLSSPARCREVGNSAVRVPFGTARQQACRLWGPGVANVQQIYLR